MARKKRPAVGAATGVRAPVRSWTSAAGALLRALVLAAFAVGGAAWALVRYYTHPRPPMVVAVPILDAAAPDGEIPAPELDLQPPPGGGSPGGR